MSELLIVLAVVQPQLKAFVRIIINQTQRKGHFYKKEYLFLVTYSEQNTNQCLILTQY